MLKQALIIEDQIRDVQRATRILRKLGIEEIEAFSRVDMALLRLEEVLEGQHPIPDLIILDLDLSTESGFEVLRLWKSNAILHEHTSIVVWTHMTDPEQELARCFGVEVVPKWTGPAGMESAVKRCSAVKCAS
jgi:CheY-like chemotaxis protein